MALGAAFAVAPLAACTNPGAVRNGARTPVSDTREFDLSPVTDAFESTVSGGSLGGASLNAVKGGKVIYRRAFGSLAVGQLAPIGDATSMPSATVLLALADAGKLSLDDTVARFIPSFTGDNAAITVRQLLTHTAGLPTDAPGLADNSVTLASSVDAIAKLPLLSAPGSAFRYSPVSYHVAGRIAEVAGGKLWDDLFDDYLGDPTGLTGFTFGKTRNYRLLDGGQSSPDDYARILDVQLHDGLFSTRRVISPASLKLMQTNQVDGIPVDVPPPTTSVGYTIGWNIEELDDSGAPRFLVAAGGAGAYAWLDLQDAYGACLTVDGDLQAAQSLAKRIQPLISDALLHPLASVTG